MIASTMKMKPYFSATLSGFFLSVILSSLVLAQSAPPVSKPAVVLHAARLLDIEAGHIVKPGEVLVQGERIVAAGTSVDHPAGAEIVDLGDLTLMPGLIDAHIHLFLHPGAEDLQTVEESVPQRTIAATLAARDDLMVVLQPSGTWERKAPARPIRRCGTRSLRA